MTHRKRILFATGSLGGGGSERQLITILRNLDRARFRPLLYLTYRQGELLGEVPEDVPIFSFWESRRVPRIYVPGRIHRMQVHEFERVLREQHVDAVYDRGFMMTMVTGPATRRCGVPRASVVVADPALDVPANAGRFVAIKKNRLRRAYADAACVATVSEGVRQSTIDYYSLADDQVITLHNAIDVQRIERLAAEAPPTLGGDRFHVVAAGRLDPQKGFLHLIEAIEQITRRESTRRIKLHILGQGPQRDELESFIESRGLTSHVQLHGFVANPYAMMAAADLFCLSSLYEGMPNALLEAIVCRVPVLATDCPSGPHEILAGGKYGTLVPTGDAAALARAIEDAMANDSMWKSRIEPAHEYVTSEFSPAAAIERLESLLMSLTNPT